ncbi:uncharacterized protein METZ01_LOCUS327791, partial [marine metagenome]
VLIQDQVEAYNRDGFVKVEGLFTESESA